jgi:GrpB-like predicted nucleotidyltransferase (UPF0157 family)/AcrR family transcriptional regulator
VTTPPPGSRAEQRRRTEARILDAATQVFFGAGYDRTTIRAVASAAGVDAGLVMHYFGSKQELFRRVIDAVPAPETGGPPGQAAEQILAGLATRLVSEPVASLTLLRSMLTNPEAASAAEAAITRYQAQIARAIPADDAGLRAAIISAITLGIMVSRHLIKADELADADPAQVIRLLRPCMRSLAARPDHSAEIVTFDDSPPPPGFSAWVGGGPRATGIEITDPDPDWPQRFRVLADRIRDVLGWRALQLEHVGSTSVPGLPAKPIIDIDLTVADPGCEQDYVPALEAAGFRLEIREPWWEGHRCLRADEPRCNLHVFGFDSPELVKHRIFRDWLRGNPGERDRYAAVKRQAAADANERGEHVMQYNARKQQVIREIYHRAFVAAGLLEE